jgi:hypothetical protein
VAPTTPTGVPSELVAGDSARWRIADLADYPQSESWTPKYELVGKSVLHQIVGVWQTSGDDAQYWLFTLTPVQTADIEAGRYRLIGRMVGSGTYTGREETVSNDVLVVLADPRAADESVFQTHIERTLAVIEAAIEGRLTADIESYQVAGRAVSKIPIEQLVALRASYAAQLRQERSGTFGQRIDVAFVNAQ